MKPHRLVSPILLALLLLTSGCKASWADLPVVSQFAASTATPTPLPTATPTSLPTAAPSPSSAAATMPPAATSTPALAATSTAVPPLPTSTPAPTATLPPAPQPTISAVEVGRGNPERPWIALTFDAGSDISPLPSILDTLRQKDVHCTFFLTSVMLEGLGPELLQQIVAEGHELGNHSYTHPQFTQLTDEGMAEELAAIEDAVVQLTGRSTKPYFRPPFGNRDDRVRRVAAQNGYLTIYWTYEVRDWTEDRTAEEIFNLAVGQASNGAIVVMHVGAWETAEKLPDIIDELRARGYRLVTLSELLSP